MRPADLGDPSALLRPLEIVGDQLRGLLAAAVITMPPLERLAQARGVVADQQRAAAERLEDAVVPHAPLALRVLVVAEDDLRGAVERRDVVERQRAAPEAMPLVAQAGND